MKIGNNEHENLKNEDENLKGIKVKEIAENLLTLEDKLELLKRNLQEVTDEKVIRKILEKRPLKIYWGTAITGRPHIAYFIPIMKIRDFINAGCHVKILLADVHGFLDNLKAPIHKINNRREYYEKIILSMLKRLGIDSTNVQIVYGSSYQYSQKYTSDLYRISVLTTIHDCIRAGSEVVKHAENPLLSSLMYPNMQALDEEYLDVDAEFGGVDQRKIFMHAAKYMPKLGYKKRIYLMNHMIPGLGTEKMSSSDESSKIDLLDSSKLIKKKINKCFCEPGNISTGILSLFKFLIFPLQLFDVSILGISYKDYDSLEEAFRLEKIHPGDLKDACFSIIDQLTAPIRQDMLMEEELIKNAYS